VTRIGKYRFSFWPLVVRLERNRLTARPKIAWEYDIKMYFKEIR
jgi:hypothetical protein